MSRSNGHGPAVAPMPVRYEPFEADFLRQAQRRAQLGSLGFDRQVITRLERMQVRHGDEWAAMPVDELVAELHREASDVGGWGVLLAQHPELYRLGEEQLLEIRMHLLEVVAAGAIVEHRVRQLAEVIAEHRPAGGAT